MMPKIGAIPGSSVNPLSKSAPEFTSKNQLPGADEDRFLKGEPARFGRGDIKPPVAPTRLSFVEDDYDTPQKQRDILHRNGLVAISDLRTQTWPQINQLLEVRKFVEAANEPKFFLAHLGKTIQVESFTSKEEWLDRVLGSAPHLHNSLSILNANAHGKEAQLECIDAILDRLDDK